MDEAATTESLSLRLVPSLGPEITLFLTMMSELRAETRETVAGLSEEDLLWVPPGGVHCIGWLLHHVARAELYWIRECFGASPAPDDLWRACSYDLKTSAVLPLERAPLDAWLTALDRVRHESVRMLQVTKDAALDSHYVHPRQAQRSCQGRWILYHVLEHEAYHRGQMAAVRGMLKRSREPGG